jgi:1,4-alpha-glucan branching enzyme
VEIVPGRAEVVVDHVENDHQAEGMRLVDPPWGAGINFDGESSGPVVRDFFVHNSLYWLEEFRLPDSSRVSQRA